MLNNCDISRNWDFGIWSLGLGDLSWLMCFTPVLPLPADFTIV